MHKDTKEAVRKHLLHYLDTRSTDYAEAPMRIEARRYVDPEYLALEHEKVIKTHPTIVAHASELGAPGSFITVTVSGVSLLVIRQDDGGVKAFSNVCRHRGAQVEAQPMGRRKLFSCPYHKWCYNRDGSIRSIPFDDGFLGVDRSEYGLVEFPADDYAGLIWVIPSPGNELDMAAYAGSELDRDILASGVADAKLYRRKRFHLDMAWKLAMDGFTDAYHLQFVHPETVGPFFHTNIYKCDVFGKNWRQVVARRGLEDFRGEEFDYDEFSKYAIASFGLYPNSNIILAPAHFEVWSIRPDPNDFRKSTADLWFLVPELPETDKARRFREKNWDILIKTVEQEDWVVAKSVADNLPNSGVDELVYGRNEKLTQHLHSQLMRDVDGAR